MRNTIVVDQKAGLAYHRWISNNRTDSGARYKVFTFWNLTNAGDVLNGKVPIYKETGPFYYRYFRDKIGVEFLQNGTVVSYVPFDRYEFDKNLSVMSDDVSIVNMNYAYLGLLDFFGNEDTIQVAYTAPLWDSWLSTTFQDQFIHDTLFYYSTDSLTKQLNRIIEDFMFKGHYSESEAIAKACDIWANRTTPGPVEHVDIPDAMIISLHGSPSGISLSSCIELRNSSVPYSFAYKNDQYNNSITKEWITADVEMMEYLQEKFGISDSQYLILTRWLRSNTFTQWVKRTLLINFQIDDISDLAYIQFGQGTVSPPLKEIYTHIFNANYPSPELFYSGGKVPIALPLLSNFLYGPNGVINNIQYMKTLYSCLIVPKTPNMSVLNATWGIDSVDVAKAIKTSVESFKNTYNLDNLKEIMETGSGLFTARSVSAWVLNGCDELSQLMIPNSYCYDYLTQMTSDEEAIFINRPSLLHTGKNNVSEIFTFIQWNGTTSNIFGFPVRGFEMEAQLAPFQVPYNISIFSPDYQQSIVLEPIFAKDVFETTNVQNISAYRFVESEETWEINEDYGNNITGFSWVGLQYFNIPVYLSRPFFYGVDSKWTENIKGIHPPGKNFTFQRPLYSQYDIDGRSGSVVSRNEVFQYNINLNSSVIEQWFSPTFGNNKILKNNMWPQVYTRDYYTMSKNQTEELRKRYEQEEMDRRIISMVLLGSIILTGLLGLILVATGLTKINRANNKYTEIQ